ncbi:MAG: hypothetical protein SFY81_06900 [Verrucomicrobiota bacterium]|nr:hypothetical protein [Verrucomicrobiota bacterium]
MKMKVLLRNLNTREFVAGKDEWTSRAGEGFDFGVSFLAYNYAIRNNIPDFEVVIRFEEYSQEIILHRSRFAGGPMETMNYAG